MTAEAYLELERAAFNRMVDRRGTAWVRARLVAMTDTACGWSWILRQVYAQARGSVRRLAMADLVRGYRREHGADMALVAWRTARALLAEEGVL